MTTHLIRKLIILFISLISASIAMASENDTLPDLTTVSHVDLNRYLGTWYEIARFPNRFQQDCDHATARYSPLEDGRIRVLNSCTPSGGGARKEVEGLAWIVDSATNSKLKVSFLPPWLIWTGIGVGDYWVIDLAEDYSYAVVSEPKRQYLWILSRTPTLDEATYQGILTRMKEKHLDPLRLIQSQSHPN